MCAYRRLSPSSRAYTHLHSIYILCNFLSRAFMSLICNFVRPNRSASCYLFVILYLGFIACLIKKLVYYAHYQRFCSENSSSCVPSCDLSSTLPIFYLLSEYIIKFLKSILRQLTFFYSKVLLFTLVE